MRREELVDLNAFLIVAEEQSFARAAAEPATADPCGLLQSCALPRPEAAAA